MNLLEIIKNPSKFIYGDKNLKPKAESEIPVTEIPDSTTSKSVVDNFISDWKGFEEAIKNADFHWILRGKTGFLIKYALPFVVIVFLVQNFYMQKPVTSIVTPPKIEDPGDNLQKPAFINQNYIFATQNEEKFYLYSPNSNKAVTFGVRGISLEEVLLPTGSESIIRMDADSYFYTKQEAVYENQLRLILYFHKIVREEDKLTGKIVERIIDKKVELKDNLGNPKFFDLEQKLHFVEKTVEGNLVIYSGIYNEPFFYVINNEGDVVYSKFEFPEGARRATYLNKELYFINHLYNEDTFLVKLNSNNEEVFSLQLKFLPATFQIINSDRFLLAYEKPSNTSFYEIEMRDGNGQTIFRFVPEESENKITSLKNIYFEPKNNNVFLFGGGIAKLFTVTGKELWIN